MLFSDSHILSTILFTPLVGAISDAFHPARAGRSAPLDGQYFWRPRVARFAAADLALQFRTSAPQFQFVENADWIPSIGAHFTLGIDGLSFLMVMLTTVLGAIAILSSWSAIHKREKEYYILLLLLQTGMLGVFMSLDFVLFYVFWEVMLVPMYFLIGVWGSERRLYAAIKFFLYTLAGSVLMLLAVLAIYCEPEHIRYPARLSSTRLRRSRAACRIGCSGDSSSRSRSRCRCFHSTPGCRTRIPKRRLRVP